MCLQKKELWVSIDEKFFVRIELTGESELLKIFTGRYIYSTIPCYSVYEKKPPIAEKGVIKINISNQKRGIVEFDIKKNLIKFSVSPKKLYIEDVVYLIYLLFTKITQENGYFIVHGSSVSHNNKGALFVGPSESGKSVTSLTLCSQKKFCLVSSDMSLLKMEADKISIIGGTKDCSMYPGTIENVFGGKKLDFLSYSHDNLWSSKIDIDENTIKKLGIRYAENATLKYIYYLRVQDSSFFAKQLKMEAMKIKSLNLLSEWIRGGNNIVISTNSLVPSFDTNETAKKRLDALNVISRSVSQFSLYGNVKDTTKFIANQLGEF